MLFLAVIGFILMNVLGIILLPRFAVCIYIWYTLAKLGYLTNNDPGWMIVPVTFLFFGTIVVFVWDILRAVSFFDGKQKTIF